MKPWGLKEGFLLGGVLVAVGLALQASAGPVRWEWLSFPVNLILLIVFVALLVAAYLLRRKVYLFEWMMHPGAAVPAMSYVLAGTVLMGLFAQRDDGGGTRWLSQMLDFWPFVLCYVWMVAIVGLATLNHLLRFKLREVPFLLNHLGLFLALICGALGAPDVQQLQMTVFDDAPQQRAMDKEGYGYEWDLSVELHRFTVDYYEDGMPRRFASDISVHLPDGRTIDRTVEVNRPLKVKGWKIYQYGYDVQRGPESRYSVFLLVRDPWLPGVYLGFFLMLAGALSLIVLKYVPRRKWVLLAALILTGFFTFLTVTRMGPSAKSLPPALQSPWFIPHLIVYMAGYAMLATATLMAVYMWVKRCPVKPGMTKKKPGMTERMDVTDYLVYVGLAFLTIGMLFGALWAKEAWGQYWSWDPKETWAAITWLSYLLYIHFRRARPQEVRIALVVLLLSFLFLQMCWWGINYLPSARGLSVHVY